MEFFNLTPFASNQAVITDKDGAETLLVIAKATYKINPGGELEPAEEQVEVLFADQYFGEPVKSSIRYESDLALAKPGLDVILIGHAWNVNPKANFVDVSLKFNNHIKTIRVFGDRYWSKNLLGYSITKPKPFEKIPLIYELAFGGTDDTLSGQQAESEPYNPIGNGFRAKKSKREVNTLKLPNLEDPKNLIKSLKDTPAPMSFGFVSRDWEPRKSFAGDYGDKWQASRMPLLPEDFDERYYNSGSSGLVLEGYVRGGEDVSIRNATKNGPLKFKMPEVALETVVGIGYDFEIKGIRFDTVIINTDDEILILVGRNSFNIQNRIYDVKFAKVQYKPERLKRNGK